MKSLLMILLSCLSLIILMNMTIRTNNTYASDTIEIDTEFVQDNNNSVLSSSIENETLYTLDSGDPNSLYGKRIANQDMLSNAVIFPEHDNNNGCGIVAMGILIKFYNDLDTVYQGEFIPNESMNYSASTWGVQLHELAQHQARANALRDDITERTPEALFGYEGNMALPNDQRVGLNNYLGYHSPNIQKKVHSKESLFQSYDITSILDNDTPVLLTLMNYNFYKEDGEFLKVAEKFHVVVAYGYRYINDKIQYLVHTGWSPGLVAEPIEWVGATDNSGEQFIYGYCYMEMKDRYDTVQVSGGLRINGLTYDNHVGILEIPSVINGKQVIQIGDNAFANQILCDEIIVSEGIKSIGKNAFYNCSSVLWITIPSSVAHIEYDAFERCASLLNYYVDENNMYYYSDWGVLFDESKVVLLSFPAGRTTTKNYAIPDSVTRINEQAFKYCSYLVSVTIPEGGGYGNRSGSVHELYIPVINYNPERRIEYSGANFRELHRIDRRLR